MAPKPRTGKKRGATTKRKQKKEDKNKKVEDVRDDEEKADFFSKLHDKLNDLAMQQQQQQQQLQAEEPLGAESQISVHQTFMSEDLPFSPDGPISRDGSSESEALSVDTQEEKACADWIQMQDCVKNRNTETFKQQKTSWCGLRALGMIHNRMADLEVQFQRDVFDLECRYMTTLYKPLLNLRETLLGFVKSSANVHVTESYIQSLVKPCLACSSYASRQGTELTCSVRKFLYGDNPPLCDDFWLRVMLHSDPPLRNLIQPADLPRLKYLRDIKVDLIKVCSDELELRAERRGCFTGGSAVGFDVRFKFSPNPYFRNNVLTKRYVIDLEPDGSDYVLVQLNHNEMENMLSCWDADIEASDPSEGEPLCKRVKLSGPPTSEKLLQYGGPQVIAIRGCKIEWFNENSPGNPCRELIPQNSKFSLEKSFFQYFENFWDKGEAVSNSHVQRDYEIGTYIRDKLVPRAYAFYRSSNTTSEYVLSAKRQRSSEIYKRKNAMETEPSEQSDCELRAKHATIEAERVKFDEERDEKARDDAVTEPSCNFPVMTSLSSQQDGTYDIVDESSCVNLDVNDRGAAGRKPGANLSSMKTGTFARTCSSQQVRSAPQRAGADRTKVALDHSNAQHETQDVDPAGYGSVFEKAFFENCNSYDDIDEVDQPICAYKSMQDRRKEFRRDCAQRYGYDDVDEAVILPPNYDEVDDRVSIPPKGVVMFSNQDQQARKPAYCPATGVFPQQSPPHCQATTSYCPENSPFCPDSTTSVQKVPPMQMDPYESVSQSRQKMFECVRKVNDIMLEKKNELERQQMLLDEQRQLAARRQFSSSGMSEYEGGMNDEARCKMATEPARRNKRGREELVESELYETDHRFSNNGNNADDELLERELRSETTGPSVNRAFQRIKYDMRTGARFRDRFDDPAISPSGSLQESSDLCQPRVTSGEPRNRSRIQYRPAHSNTSEGDLDRSSDAASSSDSCTAMAEEGVFNMLTPETSESDMDSRNLIDEYRWQQDKHLCYPCTIGQCSKGVEESEENTITTKIITADYDSEAPQTLTDTTSACRQQ